MRKWSEEHWDASINARSRRVGLGVIVRDSEG